MTRGEMRALRPGVLVISHESHDRGKVIRQEPTGLLILWRTGIKEFVVWSGSKTLSRAHDKKRAYMTPEERRAAIRRQLAVHETMPVCEQRRILREIEELQRERRRTGHVPRAKPSEKLYQEPVYSGAESAEGEEDE